MSKNSGALFSWRNGKKVDAALHDEILRGGTGDAEEVGRDVARRIGLTEEEMQIAYGGKLS